MITGLIDQLSFPAMVAGAFLVSLTAISVILFFVPGLLHFWRLRQVGRALRNLSETAPLPQVRAVFAADRALAHLWNEYEETLHEQRHARDGQMVIVAVRSTVPAEAYFNTDSVVDGRLGTEFFKHFPGIFTGIGIIGTFAGLIEGLKQFQVSENAATARASLQVLMHEVGTAFIVSASAIGLAMVVTFFEKLLLATLYRQAERLAHDIDARFEAGAGEEYLSRLVKASEESASQSKILKDALVKELGDLLRELTESQVRANADLHKLLAERIDKAAKTGADASLEANRLLADQLDRTIRSALEGPLAKLAEVVGKASGDQSAAAVRMLNDVMTSFSQKLNDLFGGQISGINELNRQTSEAMQQAVASLNALVDKLAATGRTSSDTMAKTMADAIRAMEERQAAINAQMQTFVEQLRKLVGDSQAETHQRLQAALDALAQRLKDVLASMGKTFDDGERGRRERDKELTDFQGALFARLAERIDQSAAGMAAATEALSRSVTSLTSVTTDAIDRMNLSADRLGAAATRFAEAGGHVGDVMDKAATVGGKLAEVSGGLTAGSAGLQEALRDYRGHREAHAQIVSELRAVIESAREQSLLSDAALRRIEESAEKLGAAQTSANEYLEGVSDVIGNAMESLRDGVSKAIGKATTDYQQQLSKAVGLIKDAIQEFESAISSFSPRR